MRAGRANAKSPRPEPGARRSKLSHATVQRTQPCWPADARAGVRFRRAEVGRPRCVAVARQGCCPSSHGGCADLNPPTSGTFPICSCVGGAYVTSRKKVWVLVVEDDALIAMDLADTLAGLGCLVLGPAPTVRRALALVEAARIDLALLDVDLHRERSTPVAEALIRRRVPFILTTATPRRDLPEPAYRGAPLLSKPVTAGALRKELNGLAFAWNSTADAGALPISPAA